MTEAHPNRKRASDLRRIAGVLLLTGSLLAVAACGDDAPSVSQLGHTEAPSASDTEKPPAPIPSTQQKPQRPPSDQLPFYSESAYPLPPESAWQERLRIFLKNPRNPGWHRISIGYNDAGQSAARVDILNGSFQPANDIAGKRIKPVFVECILGRPYRVEGSRFNQDQPLPGEFCANNMIDYGKDSDKDGSVENELGMLPPVEMLFDIKKLGSMYLKLPKPPSY
ncbi:MAG TPA: hypothetical protein VF572_01160 [Candidatus Saccharimonadales bacterium]|jgi:hypothetical protein